MPEDDRRRNELRTCPRCGERQLERFELASGLRDVCVKCGYFVPASDETSGQD